jgi:hypothetical protein
MENIFFFGCWSGAGHHLQDATGRVRYQLPQDFPMPPDFLDTGLLPPKLPEVEGRATFVHLNGWTIISFWDRSVDTRGKCNSAFVMRGIYSFEDAIEKAKAAFPQIWKRFTFEVVERKFGSMA